MMTRPSYEELTPGMTLREVEARVGKPWEINPMPLGQFEAIYSERMPLGSGQREERLYILQFRDGRLVNKRLELVSGPPRAINMHF